MLPQPPGRARLWVWAALRAPRGAPQSRRPRWQQTALQPACANAAHVAPLTAQAKAKGKTDPNPTPNPTLTPAQAKAKEKNVEIILPVDFVTSSKFGEDGEIATVTKVRVRVRP